MASLPPLPTAVWTAVSPAPVVDNGQYTVANPISGAQQFFRLSPSVDWWIIGLVDGWGGRPGRLAEKWWQKD
jgi:hypothetical protein